MRAVERLASNDEPMVLTRAYEKNIQTNSLYHQRVGKKILPFQNIRVKMIPGETVASDEIFGEIRGWTFLSKTQNHIAHTSSAEAGGGAGAGDAARGSSSSGCEA